MTSLYTPDSSALASPPPRGRFIATVAASVPICREHFRLTLHLPTFPPTFPGQFIQVACQSLDLDYTPEHQFDWTTAAPTSLAGRELISPLALLRRPLSLAGRRDLPDSSVELDIIHRVVGVGTAWLSRLAPDDRVHILGPLGNHFQLPPPETPAILVAGGVGIPPMLYLASTLPGRAIFFTGAITRDLLPLTITPDFPTPASTSIEPLNNIAELAQYNIPSVLTTDDGSYAFHGLVTQALEQYLTRFFPLTPPTIYTCGPEPMMKRVAQIALARNLPCQISVERSMACGMGTCQSCVIRVRKPDPAKPPLAGKDWSYKLACADGPVFSAADLLW